MSTSSERPAVLLDLVRVEVDPPLHPQRGVAGANRVVLVPDRRPEQRHDPVAHHLVDRALVVVDRLHHALQHRVEALPCLLGITVGQELHGALQICEEDRDLLSLALESRLRVKNPLREMLRRAGLR